MPRYLKDYETATIYGLCDPRSGELRYIGVTVAKLATRLSGHLTESVAHYAKDTEKKRWLNELTAAGFTPEVFSIETVQFDGHRQEEQFWIHYFRALGCRLTNQWGIHTEFLKNAWSDERRERRVFMKAYQKWLCGRQGTPALYDLFVAQYEQP
jgi:hypothetical protein